MQKNPTSFFYKYWTILKEDHSSTYTTGIPTKVTFDVCMPK